MSAKTGKKISVSIDFIVSAYQPGAACFWNSLFSTTRSTQRARSSTPSSLPPPLRLHFPLQTACWMPRGCPPLPLGADKASKQRAQQRAYNAARRGPSRDAAAGPVPRGCTAGSTSAAPGLCPVLFARETMSTTCSSTLPAAAPRPLSCAVRT